MSQKKDKNVSVGNGSSRYIPDEAIQIIDELEKLTGTRYKKYEIWIKVVEFGRPKYIEFLNKVKELEEEYKKL